MTRRIRKPKAAANLESLSWADLVALGHAGRLTWIEVNRIDRENGRQRFGADPYQHLRDEYEREHR